jgi:release factor glutamine methyltransferase
VTRFEEARTYLRSCGIDHPGGDVQLIAAFCAGLPLRTALGSAPPPFTTAQEAKFRRLVARRGERREPVAYLVGNAEFMGLEFQVTPSVLIPRPSTETLVGKAGGPKTFLEIGTGSGAISVMLALAGGRGTATDVSPRALDVARENGRLHGVADRIAFVEADLFVDGSWDLVISNPPYVATGEMDALPPEVLHEPRIALEAGVDGLDVIRRIVAGARSRAPRLLVEFGATRTVRALRERLGELAGNDPDGELNRDSADPAGERMDPSGTGTWRTYHLPGAWISTWELVVEHFRRTEEANVRPSEVLELLAADFVAGRPVDLPADPPEAPPAAAAVNSGVDTRWDRQRPGPPIDWRKMMEEVAHCWNFRSR